MDDGQTGEWLPLAEASQRLGVTVDSLRKRVRRGHVMARKGNDGRVLVHVPVQPDGQPTAGRWPADGEAGLDDGLAEELAAARADVERWRVLAGQREVALARVEELAKAAAELASVQVQAARRETDQARREVELAARAHEQLLAELRQVLEHERARGDRLEAELRRPWWRRLIG